MRRRHGNAQATYRGEIEAGIVRLVLQRAIKAVPGDLALKVEEMEVLEHFKRCGSPGVEWSCWPPADSEKLVFEVISSASTVVDVNMVDAIGVDDAECCVCSYLRPTRRPIGVS